MARHSIGSLDDYSDGAAVARDVDGLGVVVWRDGEEVCVVRNHCPHLGLSLTKGPGGMHAEEGAITCPWHASRFDLCSGDNLDWVVGFAGRGMPKWSQKLVAMGKKPSPLTTYTVIREGDELFVDL
jgi:nitrite reductase/ring-hydroxylating ferredoxin subunit